MTGLYMCDLQALLAIVIILASLAVALGAILLDHWIFVQPWEPTSPELSEEIRKIFEKEGK